MTSSITRESSRGSTHSIDAASSNVSISPITNSISCPISSGVISFYYFGAMKRHTIIYLLGTIMMIANALFLVPYLIEELGKSFDK